MRLHGLPFLTFLSSLRVQIRSVRDRLCHQLEETVAHKDRPDPREAPRLHLAEAAERTDRLGRRALLSWFPVAGFVGYIGHKGCPDWREGQRPHC